MEDLIWAKFVSAEKFFEGKRILLDFMENFEQKDCIFVGNTCAGFVSLVSENHSGENYKPRTFRFNAGALHQYIVLSETETRYLDELLPGDKVLIKTASGFGRFPIARIKKEIRPFVKLTFHTEEQKVEVIAQSNATVSVLTPNGIKPIDALKENDEVLIRKWGKASHLGATKDEYCEEL